MEKYQFSREDFEMYKDFFEKRLDEIEVVSIDSVDKSTNQKHDKTFRGILKSKEEMTKFLEDFIGLEVSSEEIEIYDSNFINKHYERRESDIIYKKKDEEIYYLIEHQSTVDKKMPQRILEYCMEIMREIQENRKDDISPLIVATVIYTGSRKWTVATDFSDTQKVSEKYKKYRIKLQYQLIDINEYNRMELVHKNTKISNMMLLEKCKTKEELKQTLIEICIFNKDNKRIQWIKDLIEYVFPEVLGKEKEKILKIIERKEENKMEDLVERITKYEERKEKILFGKGRIKGRSEGIQETITNMIKNMLKFGQDDETIMKFTNASKKQIENVKKQLQII